MLCFTSFPYFPRGTQFASSAYSWWFECVVGRCVRWQFYIKIGLWIISIRISIRLHFHNSINYVLRFRFSHSFILIRRLFYNSSIFSAMWFFPLHHAQSLFHETEAENYAQTNSFESEINMRGFKQKQYLSFISLSLAELVVAHYAILPL